MQNSIFVLFFLAAMAAAAPPRKLALVQQQPLILNYHNGPLLKGNYTINPIFYGKFSPSQISIISDFIRSLSSPSPLHTSVSSWFATTYRYKSGPTKLSLGPILVDDKYSSGKSLTSVSLSALASRGSHRNAITAVFTSSDVFVEGFCMSRCGTHGSALAGKHDKSKFAYLWVGNSETQCPGQCAWPFHQPIYGPQTPPLVAPNGDVGVDGMIINLATVLAGTVTNPFGNGFYQGDGNAGLEAVSACTGVFGSGAYPGYAGKVLVDPVSGASYNAKGVNGRKYLLPAMWDPKSSQCATLV